MIRIYYDNQTEFDSVEKFLFGNLASSPEIVRNLLKALYSHNVANTPVATTTDTTPAVSASSTFARGLGSKAYGTKSIFDLVKDIFDSNPNQSFTVDDLVSRIPTPVRPYKALRANVYNTLSLLKRAGYITGPQYKKI